MVGTTIEAAARKGESGFGYQRSVDHRVKTCKPARGTTSPTQRVQIATDKRKHDLSPSLAATQEKETRGELVRRRLRLYTQMHRVSSYRWRNILGSGSRYPTI